MLATMLGGSWFQITLCVGETVKDLVRAFGRSVRHDGIGVTLRRMSMFVGQRLFTQQPDFAQHRYLLSERLASAMRMRVAYGPFAGQELCPESWWSAADRGSMLLGLYESEVLEALVDLAPGHTTLVDVGAADGYYAVGAVRSKLYSRAVCFEMSAAGREVIQANAQRNHVAEWITILGTAGPNFLNEIPRSSWSGASDAVFLFDIEGAEFDLLDSSNLEALRESCLIVEVHEPIGANGGRAEVLRRDASQHFDIREVVTGTRNLSTFPELASWSDDDRWILCSESRGYLMRWWILTPKN